MLACRAWRTPRAHFLVKSEPYKYSFAELCRDGQTRWDGVRSFEARNNLRAMRVGDRVLFYHSNEGKEVVGVAQVLTAAYPDPTAPGEDWSVVDLMPVIALTKPVTLATIKAEPRLAAINLLRRSRLSVVPITAAEFALLLQLSGTKLPSTKSAAAKPRPTKSAAAKPRSTKSAAAKPRPTKSAAAKPRSTKSTAAKPRPAKRAAAKPRPTASTRPRSAAP